MTIRQVPTISIILLTHATLPHVGAYAHCCKHIPLFSRIPVYATTPVISLSRTLLQDLYVSTPLAASFLPASSVANSSYGLASPILGRTNILLPPPTSEEIGIYFAPAYALNYSQPHQPLPSPFSPPLDGLTITAYGAGHSLGGTIWQIQYGSESIVYAVDWHQARENVFPGAAWLSGSTGAEIAEPLRHPTALVCSSKGAEAVAAPGGRQQRDEQLLSKLRSAIQQGGNILIPCDTSARVLDMAYMLDRAWTLEKGPSAAHSLQKAKLYFASSTASATLRYARSMLEWMDESVTREFEAANSGQAAHGKANQPFELKHLKLIERKSQLDRVLSHSGCRVFLASDSSLEWGLSRHLLDTLAAQANNLVILTESTVGEAEPSTSLSSRLRQILRQRKEKSGSSAFVQLEGEILYTKETQTSPLAGNDLPIYQQYLARQRQRQDVTLDKGATTIETSADVVEEGSESSSSSDEESDTEHQGKSMNISAALTNSKNKLGLTDEELGINVLVRRKNVHDFDMRGKKGRDKVFPFVAKRRRNDDFGDLIRPEEYLRAEERDEVEGQETAAETKKDNAPIGQKRKWGDTVFGKADGGKRRNSGSAAKRRKGGINGDISKATANGLDATGSDVEESEEESDYEPAEAVLRGPMKATFTKSSITLKMKLTSIDFSGIHDQRSLQMLIPLIKPRKLILTGGTESETMTLADTCRKLLAASDLGQPKADTKIVFAPSIGEAVDASVDTNAWTIKLSQDLFRKLQWQTIRQLGIVTINGRLELEEQSTEQPQDPEAKRQKIDDANESTAKANTKEQTSQVAPILKDLPTNLAGPKRLTNQPLHVGDLRLAELRKIMQADGHTAEFKGEGTILVDGLIAVRKSGIGKIEIEGGEFAMPGTSARLPGASFDNVKRKIYKGLALVAAR